MKICVLPLILICINAWQLPGLMPKSYKAQDKLDIMVG